MHCPGWLPGCGETGGERDGFAIPININMYPTINEKEKASI
jgi:hypothetical protein